MPDLMDHKVTRLSNVSVSLPRWQIEGKLVDSETQQTVLADFTGSNAIVFPAVLASLSADEREEFVRTSLLWLLQKRFPGAYA